MLNHRLSWEGMKGGAADPLEAILRHRRLYTAGSRHAPIQNAITVSLPLGETSDALILWAACIYTYCCQCKD